MTIEDRLSNIEQLLETLVRDQRSQGAKRQHEGGHWGSRAEAAKHHGGVSLDTVDAWIKAGTLRAERRGPEPKEIRRDKLGRKIDRRRVLVWIEGAPKTADEIAQLAAEARAR